jgi:hypothetical protein
MLTALAEAQRREVRRTRNYKIFLTLRLGEINFPGRSLFIRGEKSKIKNPKYPKSKIQGVINGRARYYAAAGA